MTTRARRDGDGWRARRRARPGSRTAASPISTSSSRAPRGDGASRLSAFVVDGRRARSRDRRAHRGDRAASAGDARASTAAACRRRAARRRRRRLQAGDAHAGRLPRLGRRGGARASRAARSTRRCASARGRSDVRRRRSADFQLTQAKLADMATAIDAAALLTYRAAWTARRRAPRADARGGDGEDRTPPSRRSGSIDAAVQISAGAA